MVKSHFDVLCSTWKLIIKVFKALTKSAEEHQSWEKGYMDCYFKMNFTGTNNKYINNVAIELRPKLNAHDKLMTSRTPLPIESEYIAEH